jgi:hypothetical protein
MNVRLSCRLRPVTSEGGSLCEPVLSHSWFSSIKVVGGRGSVHTIFGSISVRSAVLGSSWLVPFWAQLVNESSARPDRADLDANAVGGNSDFWTDVYRA